MFYKNEKKEVFNDYYIYKALDELLPITENDFNNFKDHVIDKYNRKGYLIYINKFYIYQPFDQKKDTPMYYRSRYDKNITSSIGLNEYLKFSGQTTEYKTNKDKQETGYDFESVMDYYLNRKEWDVVGIIDKEPNKKKLKSFDELTDVFKIRERMKKKTDKRRGIGIQTLTGTVCFNSQTKEHLQSILKKLEIKPIDDSRISMCDQIKEKLLEMEKYGTEKEGNKMTYIIIPANHPIYPFPYNLEDRVETIVNKINDEYEKNLSINVSEHSDKGKTFYRITIKHSDEITDLKKFGAQKIQSNWVIEVK